MEKEFNQVSIEQDEKYFRVFWKIGTHKLHSEKLNLETAFELAYTIRKRLGGYI